MKLSYKSPFFENVKRHFIDAEITTDHPCSHYGQPVIILKDGDMLDYFSAFILEYQIEEISEDERPLLDAWQKARPPMPM